LIDDAGCANSRQGFRQRKALLARREKYILDALRNDKNAQAGKHTIGIVSQLLLQDADALISQNPATRKSLSTTCRKREARHRPKKPATSISTCVPPSSWTRIPPSVDEGTIAEFEAVCPWNAFN